MFVSARATPHQASYLPRKFESLYRLGPTQMSHGGHGGHGADSDESRREHAGYQCLGCRQTWSTLFALGQHTHVSELWVACLRLWDQLRWVVTVNSTLLSDNLGLKHFNFKFVILRSPRQECSRTTVCSPSSGSLPPLNRVPNSPRNPSSQHLQNLKYRT